MNLFESVSPGLNTTIYTACLNMSRELGTNVWIKLDDLCGVALDGNKFRKLEYLLVDDQAQDCDFAMTIG